MSVFPQKHVNLINSEKPSDIYQVVADKTVLKLEQAVGQKRTMSENDHPEEGEVSDTTLAKW